MSTDPTDYTALTDEEWAARLTPTEFRVLRRAGTEPAFSGEYTDTKTTGVYRCRACGEELFRSDAKFNSSTGWPSFFSPMPGALTEHVDTSLGMRRTEVRSASSGIHLGHVFNDGPAPSYKRYCINGNVLKFIPD